MRLRWVKGRAKRSIFTIKWKSARANLVEMMLGRTEPKREEKRGSPSVAPKVSPYPGDSPFLGLQQLGCLVDRPIIIANTLLGIYLL